MIEISLLIQIQNNNIKSIIKKTPKNLSFIINYFFLNNKNLEFEK